MKLRIYDPIVLAIDLRHRRFGYAAFESRKVLLSWGHRVYRAVGELERALAQRRIAKLLEEIRPDVIVLKKERWAKGLTDRYLGNVVRAVQEEASSRSIPIYLIEGKDVAKTFGIFQCTNREQIAATLARMFPELAWSIPPKRKAWQSEHPRLSVFDAIALGVTFWLTIGPSLIANLNFGQPA